MTPAEQLASGSLSFALVADVFLKLGIVLILIYLSLRLLRQYARQAPVLPPGYGLPGRLSQWLQRETVPLPTAVRTLQVHPLNRQVTLYLIECEDQRLLMSVSGQQVQLLSQWPATPDTD